MRKQMKGLAILLLFVTCSSIAGAQEFGGFPPSTRWKQINDDTVRIIYTGGAEWQANRISSLIHRAAADTFYSLGPKLRKINILLQSHTTLANGYVALAPFRSEFFLVPGSNVFDFGNLRWFENLAIHEYRHVQQYNNFRHGLAKGFYYLFGEQGLAFANAITVPDWFFEGDAVHTETALTTQGRGRLPLFLSAYNSLWLEKKNYSWQKLRNGSLKDYVPNHYNLGYLLVNYGYLKYGDEFWKNVTHDASGFRGVFYPFQKAVTRYSGLSYQTFRKQAFDFYKSKLKDSFTVQEEKNKTVINYFFPQFIGKDSLLYLRTAYNKIPAFFIRTGGREKKIAQQFISSEEWFGFRNGNIVYTAFSANPRWSLSDYSDIILLDLKTGKQKRITSKHKYYTPDLSPSGKKIVTVCYTDSVQTELHILDAVTGKLLWKLSSGNEILSQPRFVDENRIVYGTTIFRSKETGTSAQEGTGSVTNFQVLDLVKGTSQPILRNSYNPIGFPYSSHDTLYFIANLDQNDDVYAVTLKNSKVFQLTTGLTGNYYPSVFMDTLVWSKFTAEGYAIKKQAVKGLMWKEVEGLNAANELKGQERQALFPVALPNNILTTSTERFTSKRYDKSTGLFHFHSWAPNYSDPEFTFSLYSDNILNTFSNELYYRYNQNELSNTLGWNSSYGGFFPMINAGLEYTYNRTIQTTTRTITLNQWEARIGYSIPLNFSRGKTYKYLSFGSNFVYNQPTVTGIYKDSLKANNAVYLEHFLSWAHYLPRALQHIYPRLGYSIYSDNRHLLNRSGYQFLETVQLFLPSFWNHSIVVTGSVQETDTSNTTFSNRFANSRGYTDFYFSRMWKVGANYHFPIFYPDFGIASIVYFQRLRGNVFYDYTRVYSRSKLSTRNLRSVGGELYFDTKWWNQQPVSFGIRFSHLLDDGFTPEDHKGANWVEFILPVNLIQR